MVEIHYFAAARAARGVPQESTEATGTLADLLDTLGNTHTETTAGGMTLAQIFDRCSFLIDGRTVTPQDAPTVDLSTVRRIDVLPPFAGG